MLIESESIHRLAFYILGDHETINTTNTVSFKQRDYDFSKGRVIPGINYIFTQQYLRSPWRAWWISCHI